MAVITFKDAETFTPFEGKGSDLFPFQGLTYGQIKKVTEGSAESGNTTLTFEIVCREPADKQGRSGEGLRVVKTIPVTGLRKDGKANVLGLYEVLTSIYSGTEGSIEKAVAKIRELDGTQMDTKELADQMVETTVWFELQTKKFQRKDTGEDAWGSEVRNFVPKQKYSDQAAIDAHHRPNPAEMSKPAQSNGASAGAAAQSSNAARTARDIM